MHALRPFILINTSEIEVYGVVQAGKRDRSAGTLALFGDWSTRNAAQPLASLVGLW